MKGHKAQPTFVENTGKKTERRPWPLKWILLAILLYVIIYNAGLIFSN